MQLRVVALTPMELAHGLLVSVHGPVVGHHPGRHVGIAGADGIEQGFAPRAQVVSALVDQGLQAWRLGHGQQELRLQA
jgi:hypothetical protein